MQVVKSKKEEQKLSKTQKEKLLKGLLFKKKILENQIQVANTGAKVTTTYLDAISKRQETIQKDSFEWVKLEYLKLKLTREASEYISDFKEFRRNYEEGLVVELQRVTKREEFNEIGFHYVEEQANELAKNEIYGKVVIRPANVELPEINNEIERYIEVLGNLITEIQSKLENDKSIDALEKARLEKELFDLITHKQTQEKRLSKRMDYYLNQFLPVYEADMKDCDENLEKYLDIANKLSSLNVDYHLKGMLDKYEEHKDDKEHLWLFFTALRTRLMSIAKHVGRNPQKMPKEFDILKSLMD